MKDVGVEMVHLDGGSVTLHDARRKIRREVELDSFQIGVHSVTQAQLARIAGTPGHPSRRPVVDISWVEAVRACNVASELDGLSPAYRFDGDRVTWTLSADGYRLPTEAEWEFGCRAGTAGPHYGSLAEIAWTDADKVDSPQDVGGKLPNSNGLYDTLGNVWEWCWDLLDPARYGDYRVFRGGGFSDDAWNVRASVRRGGAPGMHHPDLGFRLARGGFAGDGVQGWSAESDLERARVVGALPSGWTPLR
ncbi:formylglycine-generating enzyme family protein [Homoserinimonas sp. A447]